MSENTHPRGVFRVSYLDSNGHRIAVAVDSQGRRIHEVRMFENDCPVEVAQMLTRFLDREDPPAYHKED